MKKNKLKIRKKLLICNIYTKSLQHFDTDEDGYSDYEEWLAGTDPNDPLSYTGKIKIIIISSAIFGESIAIGIVLTIVITRKRKTA